MKGIRDHKTKQKEEADQHTTTMMKQEKTTKSGEDQDEVDERKRAGDKKAGFHSLVPWSN